MCDQIRSPHVVFYIHVLVVFNFFAIFLSPPVFALDVDTARIPLVFSRGKDSLTSACLEFTQKIYDQSWEEFKANANTPFEKALVGTINAMAAKDKAQFTAMAHPDFIAKSKEFDQQANIYFAQFTSMAIQRVNRGVFYKDLVIFYVQLSYGKKSDYARLVFKTIEGDAAYGFLQNADSAVAPRLVWDWFISDWGPRKSPSPAYCTDAVGVYRVALGGEDVLYHAVLTLSGTEPVAGNEAIAQFNRMHEHMAAGRMQEYFNEFKEKERYVNWFMSEANDMERKQYIEHEMSKKAVFVFDLDPVFVVYAKRPNAAIDPFDVLFFVRNSEKVLKLESPSMGSTFNDLFQSKEFRAAAVEETPFKSMRKQL